MNVIDNKCAAEKALIDGVVNTFIENETGTLLNILAKTDFGYIS